MVFRTTLRLQEEQKAILEQQKEEARRKSEQNRYKIIFILIALTNILQKQELLSFSDNWVFRIIYPLK